MWKLGDTLICVNNSKGEEDNMRLIKGNIYKIVHPTSMGQHEGGVIVWGGKYDCYYKSHRFVKADFNYYNKICGKK